MLPAIYQSTHNLQKGQIDITTSAKYYDAHLNSNNILKFNEI